MVVFVCSPYGGKQSNIDKAINYCAMEIELGNVPYAPHVFFPQILDEETDRQLCIDMGIEILERVDEVHVWGNKVTAGMQMEIEAAESMGITVCYMEA